MTIRIGVLTISDRSSRGERPDATGPAIESVLVSQGWQVIQRLVVPDELQAIQDVLVSWSDSGELDVILTNGGTGFSPRDVTPEATLAVIDRLAPGLPEAMRAASMKVTPHAMLSRLAAGIRGRVLIVNLPGSPRGALENLEVISPVLPHAVSLLHEDRDAEAGHRIPPTRNEK